jgi:hypothetical protein
MVTTTAQAGCRGPGCGVHQQCVDAGAAKVPGEPSYADRDLGDITADGDLLGVPALEQPTENPKTTQSHAREVARRAMTTADK